MPATPAELFAYLDRLGIAHPTVTHPPVFTIEEARELRGQIAGAHTKNLFLRDKRGALYLVTARGRRHRAQVAASPPWRERTVFVRLGRPVAGHSWGGAGLGDAVRGPQRYGRPRDGGARRHHDGAPNPQLSSAGQYDDDLDRTRRSEQVPRCDRPPGPDRGGVRPPDL